MRTKRFLAGAAASVTALTFVGACAAQVKHLEPKLELRDAAQHLAGAQQAGFTLKLTGSADDLIAGMKLTDDAEPMTDDETSSVKTVFNSSVSIAYDKAGDGVADDRMQLAATVDGVTGTEIRVVGTTLYAKAPVTELAEKFGGDAGEVAELRKQASTEAPELGKFFEGGWVSVDTKDATKFTTGVPTDQVDSEKTLAEIKKSAQSLFDGADVVRDKADDKHLVVTTSTTKAYTEMKRLVTAVSGQLGAGGADLDDELGKAPKDRPVVLDLWIDGGKLTALEVNVLQFIDGAAGRAAVRLEVTTGAPIEAPADATKIDLSKLTEGVSTTGGVGVGLGSDGTAEEQAEMLGYSAQMKAAISQGKPAKYLPKAIAELKATGVKVKLVRSGVAQVTVDGVSACVTVPKSLEKEPTVVKGAC